MIKALGKDGNGRTALFLGLSRKNTERLLQGKPIVVRLDELDATLPGMDVVLLGGETEADITEDLRSIGPLPEGM